MQTPCLFIKGTWTLVEFWYPWGVLEPTPHGYSGTTVCRLFEIVNVLCKVPASVFIKKDGFLFFCNVLWRFWNHDLYLFHKRCLEMLPYFVCFGRVCVKDDYISSLNVWKFLLVEPFEPRFLLLLFVFVVTIERVSIVDTFKWSIYHYLGFLWDVVELSLVGFSFRGEIFPFHLNIIDINLFIILSL